MRPARPWRGWRAALFFAAPYPPPPGSPPHRVLRRGRRPITATSCSSNRFRTCPSSRGQIVSAGKMARSLKPGFSATRVVADTSSVPGRGLRADLARSCTRRSASPRPSWRPWWGHSTGRSTTAGSGRRERAEKFEFGWTVAGYSDSEALARSAITSTRSGVISPSPTIASRSGRTARRRSSWSTTSISTGRSLESERIRVGCGDAAWRQSLDAPEDRRAREPVQRPSSTGWSGWSDSNRRSRAPKARALPDYATPRARTPAKPSTGAGAVRSARRRL